MTDQLCIGGNLDRFPKKHTQKKPEIAETIDVACQIDAVAQRGGRPGAGRDDGKVEDGERNHRNKLVRDVWPTKGRNAQGRPAPSRPERDNGYPICGTKQLKFTVSALCPPCTRQF